MKYLANECGLPGQLDGGFGDRLLGLATTLSFCDVTGASLLIKWHDGKIDGSFDYQDCKYTENVSEFNHISNTEFGPYVHNDYLKHLMTRVDVKKAFDDKDTIIRTNLNLWQSLFTNENYDLSEYENYTVSLFQRIFSKYLKPKKHILEQVDEIIGEDEHVGIQIRMGDIFMHQERPHTMNAGGQHFGCDDNELARFINKILEENEGKKIFLTSDINLKKLDGLIDFSRIKYVDKIPTHIERSADISEIEKTYVDFFCLARCEKHYVSNTSNFGRTAAILGGSKNCNLIFNEGEKLSHRQSTISELSCKKWNEWRNIHPLLMIGNLIVYINVAVMGNVNEVLDKILNRMKESGLTESAYRIVLAVCGDIRTLRYEPNEKYRVVHVSHSVDQYEFPALSKMWHDSRFDDDWKLYIHTKGVSRNNPFVNDWVEFLSYYNIDLWRERLNELEHNDCTGVNLKGNPADIDSHPLWWGYGKAPLHYSGNFWWTKSSHIRTLPEPYSWTPDSELGKWRMMPEMWVCSNGTAKYNNAFSSDVDHYTTPYPKYIYEKKI